MSTKSHENLARNANHSGFRPRVSHDNGRKKIVGKPGGGQSQAQRVASAKSKGDQQ